jgi:hypothetical protein
MMILIGQLFPSLLLMVKLLKQLARIKLAT